MRFKRSTARDSFPILVKSIPMAKEERMRLQRAFTMHERTRRAINDILMSALSDAVEAEEATWDSLCSQFGFEGMPDLHSRGHSIVLDWKSSVIELRKEADDDAAPGGRER